MSQAPKGPPAFLPPAGLQPLGKVLNLSRPEKEQAVSNLKLATGLFNLMIIPNPHYLLSPGPLSSSLTLRLQKMPQFQVKLFFPKYGLGVMGAQAPSPLPTHGPCNSALFLRHSKGTLKKPTAPVQVLPRTSV